MPAQAGKTHTHTHTQSLVTEGRTGREASGGRTVTLTGDRRGTYHNTTCTPPFQGSVCVAYNHRATTTTYRISHLNFGVRQHIRGPLAIQQRHWRRAHSTRPRQSTVPPCRRPYRPSLSRLHPTRAPPPRRHSWARETSHVRPTYDRPSCLMKALCGIHPLEKRASSVMWQPRH